MLIYMYLFIKLLLIDNLCNPYSRYLLLTIREMFNWFAETRREYNDCESLLTSAVDFLSTFSQLIKTSRLSDLSCYLWTYTLTPRSYNLFYLKKKNWEREGKKVRDTWKISFALSETFTVPGTS